MTRGPRAVPHKGFKGVFWIQDGRRRNLATENLVPGFKSYDETSVVIDGREYRIWLPRRSKPAAAILNGLRNFPLKPGSRVLYLGIASGTTASHFSDIVGERGIIYGVEISQRVLRELLAVAEARRNIVPILASARRPEEYAHVVEMVDLLYVDVAQPDQAEILLKNADAYLRRGGYAMIAVKASSIDVTLPPKRVYRLVEDRFSRGGMKVLERVDLSPFDPKHAMIVVRK